MDNISLSQITKILGLAPVNHDSIIQGVSIDSRSIKPGELFIAIKGERFDGHDFIANAIENGAIAIIASREVNASIPVIKVDDTIKAFAKLASYWRDQFNIPVLAMTGSCGKTTTKTFLASIMSQCGSVLAPLASFNNDIGLPLTLLRLRPQHQFAVIELGANHFGEISRLTQTAKPTVAAITNIAPVHLEGFGDLDGVSRAKGEIFQGLQADGIAVINGDDPYANFLIGLIGKRQYFTFGRGAKNDIRAEDVQLNNEGYASFKLITPNGETAITLPVLGEHNVMNALAAAAMAHAVGASLSQMKQGLATAEGVAKRLVKKTGLSGAKVIDDTYNANLLAAKAALNLLARQVGEKLFVFGGMAELGSMAETHHDEIGKYAREVGIEHLYAVGPYSHLTVESFGQGGTYFKNKQEMITAIQGMLHPQLTVLVKGSRSARMEEVVEAIIVNNS